METSPRALWSQLLSHRLTFTFYSLLIAPKFIIRFEQGVVNPI